MWLKKPNNQIVFISLIFLIQINVHVHAQWIDVEKIAIRSPQTKPSETVISKEREAINDLQNETRYRYQEIDNFLYFDQTPASAELIKLIHWIRETGDNRNAPYLVVDKVHAQLLIFYGNGTLAATTPVLLGMAKGDIVTLENAQQELGNIKPADRITPMGRFALEFGHDSNGQDILWIDYDAAISLHRVFEGDATEHRIKRLQTPSSSDNRISFGCINVSKEFYEKTIRSIFVDSAGFAYILPEEHALKLPFQ